MSRPPHKSTRTDTPFPYTTRVRAARRSGGASANYAAATRSVLDAAGATRYITPSRPGGWYRHPPRRSGSSSAWRSEEHTSELQSLMRTSYAVFRLHTKSNTHVHSTILHVVTTCNSIHDQLHN